MNVKKIVEESVDNEKIQLSYSLIDEIIKTPHAWLNRQMQLKKRDNQYFEKGKAAHKVIQAHLCGKEINPILEGQGLPQFSTVEEIDRDPRLKVEMPLNDKYSFVGYIDAKNDDPLRGAEIKTGSKKWTVGDFSRLNQWKLYSLCSGIKVWYLINTPFDPKEWNIETVKIYKATITKNDEVDARLFIQKGIDIIENIDKMDLYRQSFWCNYENCEFCAQGMMEVH